MPRRRLSYANVVATLALVLAMSGGALAAGHYLINSTKQINPKVLKKLRGARGTTGPRGATGLAGVGSQGPTGKNGKDGAPGTSADATIATAFVQMSFSSPIALPLENALVLSTNKSGGGKNLSVPPAGAHVVVNASLRVSNPGPERYVTSCQFGYEGLGGAGPAVLFGQISEVGLESPLPQAPVPAEVPMTANIALVGGETYDLRIYCHANSIERVKVEAASLTAVAQS